MTDITATETPGTPDRGSLLKVLGTTFGLAIAVGATIGGGILRTPGEIAAALPSPVLYLAVWVLGAGASLLGANMYSELGTMMPFSGGQYVFARRAFGDGIGFFVGYADWLNWCLGPVVLILIVGEYMAGLFPVLAGHELAVDFVTLGGLATLQWIGVRSGSRTQEVTSLLKTLALIALVVAAFVLPHAPLAPVQATQPHGLSLVLAFGVAMQGVIFTYDSYYLVVYCGEEMRDPGREIPGSMFRGLWLIIGIYLLVNLAYLRVVPVSRMAGDPFVGATMARALFGLHGDTVIRLIMIISILGTINAELMAIPRILLAMSRDGLFPRRAGRVNRGGTPHVALGLSLAVIMGFLLSGSFNTALALDTILIVLLYVCSFAALLMLRRREPDTPRPYRAWGYPLVPAATLLGAAGLLAAISASDLRSAVIIGIALLVSWPLARAVRRLETGRSRST